MELEPRRRRWGSSMAGNPFDQFDPSASSAAPAANSNPFDQFDPKAAPTQSKPAALGGVSDPANWALAGLDHLGMGLGTKNPFMALPEQFKQDVAQSHRNLGLLDYPLAAAAYAVGPGRDPWAGRRRRLVVPGLAA